ncbi:MAG: type I restriction enzyme HsdR N-terminal domain-containing protein [Prevotellaceae bacterium]|nr:type I restriction enzyme HsdR N-terminal domain-containing protein [Candidatus Faecinaster equi]
MKFQKLWETFKQSEQARKFIEVFEAQSNNPLERIDIIGNIFEEMSSLGETTSKDDAQWWGFQLMVNFPELSDEQLDNLYEHFIDNLEIWSAYLDGDNIVYGEKKRDCLLPKGNYRALNNLMHIISTYLYTIDGFYKPIFYSDHFDWIQKNCELLKIELPDIPRTKDYRRYSLYYIELCECFKKFQEENDLSDSEFLCYLYLFGYKLWDEELQSELPRPTNVWMTGANPWDWEKLENGEISTSAWACNEDTQRGDIVIVYAVTPHSCFHSIWRASSGGCFNPFNYYHCRTTITDGNPIIQIKYKDFMADPILSNFKIGHKNLQGVNGFPISASEYSAFLQKLKTLGCEITTLPQLVSINSNWTKPTIEGKNPEKQVEEKLIKPLLHDILGYNVDDYTQQARHKSGRKEKSIPDFVFFQEGEHGLEHCPFIIEAKHDFKSTCQRRKDYDQGLCYAQTYHSKLMSIIDMNRVIVYKVDQNGCADYTKPIFEAQWEVIYSDPDMMNKLQKLIGREVVKQLK